ncbi:MAG: hypothetical protein H6710_21535 [Myxococcales bacterium]|nr:hypothetical protein [Myxococcales bacterium]
MASGRSAAKPTLLACLVIALWSLAQLSALVRGLLPEGAPGARTLPWNMFSTPRAVQIDVRAEGRRADGAWVEIPLDRYFHFTRGATGQRLYMSSRILTTPGHREERRRFALWLAARVAAEGAPVVEVRLIRESTSLATHEVKRRVLGRFETGDADGPGGGAGG